MGIGRNESLVGCVGRKSLTLRLPRQVIALDLLVEIAARHVQAAERAYLLAKLKEHDWNVSETARTLNMPRSNLYKKIERYHLAREAQCETLAAAPPTER